MRKGGHHPPSRAPFILMGVGGTICVLIGLFIALPILDNLDDSRPSPKLAIAIFGIGVALLYRAKYSWKSRRKE